MIKFIFLISFAGTLLFADSNECPHAISIDKVEKTSSENSADGSIRIKVQSSSAYTCTLSRVSASKGVEDLETKSSTGNSTITFTSLKKYKLYQAKVEFVDEEGDCRVLELFPISVQ